MIDVQAMPFWVLLLFSCLCFSNSLTISFHQRPRIGLWLQVASSSTDDSSPARRRRDNDDDYSTPQKPNKKAPTSRSVAAMALMESNEENQIFPIRKLESDPNYLGLPVRDKAYARMILSIVERRRGQIDKVLKNFMQKSTRFRKVSIIMLLHIYFLISSSPSAYFDRRYVVYLLSVSKNRSPDMLCQAALRIGAAQLLFLETPSYAVIKETVDVLRKSPTIKVQ
jgi:transcription termination factor NusB